MEETKSLTFQKFNPLNFLYSRVSSADKAFLSRQLATMLTSGIHLTQALSILSTQIKRKFVKESIEEIIKDLEGGFSFSTAIARHPKVFNRAFVAAVRSGEASGQLDRVLTQLAEQLEHEAGFVSKLRSAMVYPLFIICVMIIVGAIVMIKVIPTLTGIFKESEIQLPLATRILIALSDFLVHYWWAVLIAIIGIILFLRFFFSGKGRSFYDSKKIAFPLFGPLNQSAYMARFCQTLGMLIQAGIPILEALDIVSDVLQNKIYTQELRKASSEVEQGVPLSVPIERSKYFPLVVSQMILVGEQTGKLDSILQSLANYYEAETDNKIKGLISLFEPAIIVLIGFGVAVMVFAVLVPIYQMTAQIK